VAEVEVGLGPVVGDEDLAVLIRAHGARIDVEIGVELAQPHLVAARLEEPRCLPSEETTPPMKMYRAMGFRI
jgi:hypothetical protein